MASIINNLGEECTFISKVNIPSAFSTYSDSSFTFEATNWYYVFAPTVSVLFHADSEWWAEIFKPHNKFDASITVFNFDRNRWQDSSLWSISNHDGNDPDPKVNLNNMYYSDYVRSSNLGYPVFAEITMRYNTGGADKFRIDIVTGSLNDASIPSPEGKEIYGGNGVDFVWRSTYQNRDGAVSHFSDTMKGSRINLGNSKFLTYVKV